MNGYAGASEPGDDLKGFRAWCQAHANLSVVEEAKAMDFLDDVRRRPDQRGGVLGAVYRGFIRLAMLLRVLNKKCGRIRVRRESSRACNSSCSRRSSCCCR